VLLLLLLQLLLLLLQLLLLLLQLLLLLLLLQLLLLSCGCHLLSGIVHGHSGRYIATTPAVGATRCWLFFNLLQLFRWYISIS